MLKHKQNWPHMNDLKVFFKSFGKIFWIFNGYGRKIQIYRYLSYQSQVKHLKIDHFLFWMHDRAYQVKTSPKNAPIRTYPHYYSALFLRNQWQTHQNVFSFLLIASIIYIKPKGWFMFLLVSDFPMKHKQSAKKSIKLCFISIFYQFHILSAKHFSTIW